MYRWNDVPPGARELLDSYATVTDAVETVIEFWKHADVVPGPQLGEGPLDEWALGCLKDFANAFTFGKLAEYGFVPPEQWEFNWVISNGIDAQSTPSYTPFEHWRS